MIYFVRTTENGPIKIGFTYNMRGRIGGLRAQFGNTIEVLGVMPGDRKREAEMHRRFDALRVPETRELFVAGTELLAFIAVKTKPWDGTDEGNGEKRTTVKLPRATVERLAFVAKHEGVSVGTLLGDLVRAPISRHYATLLRAMLEQG